MEEFKPRVRWSEFPYHQPIELVIKDWKNLKVYMRKYLLIPSAFAYKDRNIELCVPYKPFVRIIMMLSIRQKKEIMESRSSFQLEKVPVRMAYHGMKVHSIKPLAVTKEN